jgi:hypothetical protein
MFSPEEGQENFAEMPKIFSQEDEQGMTAVLEPAKEEGADIMDFVDLCEELETLERRVIVKRMHMRL